jgi:hypothetical protein
MRTLNLVVLALVLFAQAACVDSKPAPKLTKITGYGEYVLGTPISEYDLSKSEAQFDEKVHRIKTGVLWYVLDTKYKLEGEGEHYALLMLGVSKDRLEAVRIFLPPEDIYQDQGVDYSYIIKTRRTLLEKYSSKMVVKDKFDTPLDLSSWKSGKSLTLKDDTGNIIVLSASPRLESMVTDYCSVKYRKLYSLAMKQYRDELEKDKQLDKNREIVGYGEYTLGTPVFLYDLSKFSGPTMDKDTFVGTGALGYAMRTKFKMEGLEYESRLTLYFIAGQLEGVSFYLDPEKCFSNMNEVSSFVLKVREHLLSEYYHDMVVYDWFDTSIFPEEAADGDLLIRDKEGNTISLSAMSPNALWEESLPKNSSIGLDIDSSAYHKCRDTASVWAQVGEY